MRILARSVRRDRRCGFVGEWDGRTTLTHASPPYAPQFVAPCALPAQARCGRTDATGWTPAGACTAEHPNTRIAHASPPHTIITPCYQPLVSSIVRLNAGALASTALLCAPETISRTCKLQGRMRCRGGHAVALQFSQHTLLRVFQWNCFDITAGISPATT